MKFLERYEASNNWREKVLVMDIFHHAMLARKGKWTLQQTADYFGVSKALVSENIKIATFDVDRFNSRADALRRLIVRKKKDDKK